MGDGERRTTIYIRWLSGVLLAGGGFVSEQRKYARHGERDEKGDGFDRRGWIEREKEEWTKKRERGCGEGGVSCSRQGGESEGNDSNHPNL